MPFLLTLPDGRHVTLEKPVVSVGTDAACDIVLHAPGVKASHALLFRDERGWTVSAAGKGCEVRVRGKRVELAPLAPGDAFVLGKATLTLERSDDAPAVSPPASEPASRGPLVAVLTGFASRLLAQRPSTELLDVTMRGLAEVTGADVGFLVSAEGERRQVLCATGPVPDAAVVDSLVDQVMASG
ncbi:FHA domain-containing protein, partial [Pyxidicoccus sp. 3LFB2]